MGGSMEVRQFLMRYDGVEGSAATPAAMPTQRTGGADANRISDDQIRRARIAVGSGAVDAEDCAELLDMLGLVPDEDGVPPVQH